MKRIRKQQRGDTIVEVIIAIAIVSLILVGAYQATRHNTAITQDTQEHAVALKLAESQLEQLQAAGGTLSAGNRCFSPDGAGNPVSVVSSCTYQPPGSGASYTISLVSDGASLPTYEAKVTWTGLTDTNNDVSLYYRPEVTP